MDEFAVNYREFRITNLLTADHRLRNMMNKQKREPQNPPKNELLSRRAAMKRIALGLAGVGVAVASGIIGPAKPVWAVDYSDAARNWDAPYSDAVRNWDAPYSDAKSDKTDYSDAKR